MPPGAAPRERRFSVRIPRLCRICGDRRDQVNRRTFLHTSSVLVTGLACGGVLRADERGQSTTFRAAVIGHTGRGDYGHGMDVLFNDRADCEVVAVADPD